jgi:hypothetical protein
MPDLHSSNGFIADFQGRHRLRRWPHCEQRLTLTEASKSASGAKIIHLLIEIPRRPFDNHISAAGAMKESIMVFHTAAISPEIQSLPSDLFPSADGPAEHLSVPDLYHHGATTVAFFLLDDI